MSRKLVRIDERGEKQKNGWTLTFLFECYLTDGSYSVFRAKNENELRSIAYNLDQVLGEWFDDGDVPKTELMLRTTLFKEARESWSDWNERGLSGLDSYNVYWADADGYVHDVSMEELDAEEIEDREGSNDLELSDTTIQS